MALIFWIFILIVFYTYVGYGILLFFLVKVKEIFRHEKSSKFTQGNKNHILPPVTLLIAAYNEEDIIEEKMKNCYNIDYPADKFEIFWITDGSNDSTNALVDKYVKSSSGDSKLPKVSLSFSTERKGKTAAINRAIPLIDSQIIVLTDANTNLNREVILEIVNKFQNPQVGCVAGEKRVNTNNSVNAAGSEGIYWKYESFLKKYDSRLNSTVGAAGELYAIRKDLFEPMPEDTLLDDFISSLHIAMKGYKIAYCDTAYALENGSANIKEESKRKVRIAAGGLQSILRLKPLLNIFKYKTLSFQYISHRVLRWSITPIILFLLLPINIVLCISSHNQILYIFILICQIFFYILAGIGKHFANRNIKYKATYIPYYFLFMNINVIKGFFYLLKRTQSGDKSGSWEKAKRK